MIATVRIFRAKPRCSSTCCTRASFVDSKRTLPGIVATSIKEDHDRRFSYEEVVKSGSRSILIFEDN